jgi:hypothetical protein
MTDAFNDPIGFGNIFDCGYKQKGNRYFLNYAGERKLHLPNFDIGFKSKKQIEEWLNENPYGYKVKYRIGFLIMFKEHANHITFVNKHNLAI